MNHIEKFAQQFAFCTLTITCLLITGCQTTDSKIQSAQADGVLEQKGAKEDTNASKALTLHEGDVVRITFSGSPNLNTTQPIRRDGKITLELAGEITAAGLTPTQLEKEIIRLCGSQLISKEVVVAVDSSSFPVFVTGAVIRPGKIMSDRPITALEAIMEAGGFDYNKASLTSVRVIRKEGGEVKNYKLNLKLALRGKPTTPFDLKPADIVYVPEKFSWF